MQKPLDLTRSQEVSLAIKSKADDCFDNAYKAALLLETATYVQGFLVLAGEPVPIEYAWIELDNSLIDPTFSYLNKDPQQVYYFEAQRLNLKKLKAAIEEAEEDYPEDPPLPIYGEAPYAYYGDVMLGGENYRIAHEVAIAKCSELISENN